MGLVLPCAGHFSSVAVSWNLSQTSPTSSGAVSSISPHLGAKRTLVHQDLMTQ